MSNAIATLSMQIVADSGGFSAGLVPVKKELKDLRGVIAAAEPETERYARQIKLLGAMWEDGLISAEHYGRAVKSLESNLTANKAAAEAAAQAERKAAESLRAATAEVEKAKQRKNEYLAQLSREVALLGKTEEQIRRVQYAEMGFTKAQIAAAEALHRKADAFHAEQKAAKDRNKVFDAELVKPSEDVGGLLGGIMPPQLMAVTGAVGPMGAAFGVAAIGIAGGTAALVGFVKATETVISTAVDGITRLDEMADSAKALGMEASAFQQLQIAATLADAPAEELFKVIGKMEQILGDPPEEAVKAFDKLGLRISTLREMGPDAFEAIAKKISELPTRAEKFAVMADVFGKVDKRMINLVDNFDAFMAKAEGFSLDESQFGAIDGADDAFKELSASITHVKDTLAVELAPALTDLVHAFGDFLNTDATQSMILTGIVMMRETLQEIADIASSIGKTFSMDSVLDAVSALGPKAALAVKGLREITEPFKEIAEAERLGRESVKAARKEAEEAKKNAGLAAGESNAKDKAAEKAAKDAEKRDADRFKKFSDALDKLHAEAEAIAGDPMEKLRLEATAAGAKDDAEIQAYIDAKKEIERLKESEQALAAIQADRAKQNERDAADFAKFMEETASPQEKAMEKLRRASELEIPDVALGKLAKSLTPKTLDQQVAGVTKGSQEAFSIIARANRATQQERLLQSILDSLKRQEKQEPIEVSEIKA